MILNFIRLSLKLKLHNFVSKNVVKIFESPGLFMVLFQVNSVQMALFCLVHNNYSLCNNSLTNYKYCFNLLQLKCCIDFELETFPLNVFKASLLAFLSAPDNLELS